MGKRLVTPSEESGPSLDLPGGSSQGVGASEGPDVANWDELLPSHGADNIDDLGEAANWGSCTQEAEQYRQVRSEAEGIQTIRCVKSGLLGLR